MDFPEVGTRFSTAENRFCMRELCSGVWSNFIAVASNFALFNVFEQNLDDARLHYEEALSIERQLAEENSTVYLPNLAMTLSNLGRVNQFQSRIGEARAHYREALNILEMLSQSTQAYASEIAKVKAGLAQLEKPGLPH